MSVLKMKRFLPKGSIRRMATSSKLESVLMPLGERVLTAAKNDPNKFYVSQLQIHTNITKSTGSKNVPKLAVVVGVRRAKAGKPDIGLIVEAKRGTLAKALGVIS